MDGRVVTVAHVLNGHGVSVSGRPARLARVDRGDDLAVLQLRIEGEHVGGRGFAVLTPGRAVPAIGTAPHHARRSTALSRPALEIRAEVSAGDSGAPVVDGRGHLLGVLFARSRSREGIAYAVDADAVGDILR